MALALVGCPSTNTKIVKEKDPDPPEPKVECKVDADCKHKGEYFACTPEGTCKEDLETIREVAEAEAPEYVKGIDEKAQDAFRAGVQAAMAVPADYEKALKHFEEAIAIDKSFLEPYFNIAMVHERRQDAEKALATYQRALKANPDSEDAKAFVGKIYLANAKRALFLGNNAKAEGLMAKGKQIFDEVLARDFENIPANNAMALYYLLKGKADKAEDYVKQVLILEPQNVTALNTRGLIFLTSGQLNFAEWIFAQKVLTLDQNSIEAHTNLGTVYVRQNKLPLAVKHFRRAVDLDENNIEARMNLGAIFIDFLNYEGARKHFEHVLGIQKDNVEAIIGLASAKLGLGDMAAAIEGYEKAIKLDKRRAVLLQRVGALYEKKGTKEAMEQAIKFYDRYIAMAQLPPSDKLVQKVTVLKQALKEGMFDAPAPEPKDPEAGGDAEPKDPEAGGDAEPKEPTGDEAPAGDAKPEGEAPADPAPEGTEEPAQS